MELLHADPATIWRMLIPKQRWLYVDEMPEDELIFTYRDKVYFVNNDGSVLAMNAPEHLSMYTLGDMFSRLAGTNETFDFDDQGIFDYGAILRHMGYMAPIVRKRDRSNYLVEIVNGLDPEMLVTRYELKKVNFTFALYHAVLRCHELNKKCDYEFEHEVKRIAKVERFVAKDLHMKH
ncbi:hypothetical protein [Brevibacillus dissolubilis]|uniref:hypothetical protein n=1 Tax=Brevibacillus dissolubilis TaxID=1844116 RepID=UPI001116610E|nr:hypothetical protein [Brevibacillus dissolubilis]